MKKSKKYLEASVASSVRGYIASAKRKSSAKSKKNWYMDQANQILSSLKESAILNEEGEIASEPEARPERFSLPKKARPSWKDRANLKVSSLDKEISNLKKQIEKLRGAGTPDLEKEDQLQSLIKQKKRTLRAVKLGGKDWEQYLVNPDLAKKQKDKEEEKVKQSKKFFKGQNEEIVKFIDAYKPYADKIKDSQVFDQKIKKSIENIIFKYAGHSRTTTKEFKKISDWVENKFWPAVQKSGYDILDFIKNKSINWNNLNYENLPQDLKDEVSSTLKNLGSLKKDSPSNSWHKWEQLPKDLQSKVSKWFADNHEKVKVSFRAPEKTTERPVSKVKQQAAGIRTGISPFQQKEIPGGTKDATSLASKLNKAYPQDKTYGPPKYKGKEMVYKGSAITDLEGAHKKTAEKIVDTLFDDIIDEIQKRNPDKDVKDILSRYIDIENSLSDEGEDIGPLKNHFSKDELKILQDIAEKTDPERLAQVPEEGYSEFEKAIAPIIKKHYQEKGYETKGAEDAEESGYSSSGANTKELALTWSNMLKVPVADLDDKLSALRKEKPDVFASLESQALSVLKKSFPLAYDKEMKARELKNKHLNKDKNVKKMEPVYKAIDNFVSAINDPEQKQKAIKSFKKALQDKDLLKKIEQNSENPKELAKILSATTQTPSDVYDKDYYKNLSSLEKVSKFQKVPKKGEASKEQRRAAQRALEPRDLSPEEMERRKKMGARAALDSEIERFKKSQKQKSSVVKLGSKNSSEDEENKMASNESKKLNLKKVLESFDNSYELDSDTEENGWEKQEPAEKKDWMKDLSLSDLFKSKSNKKKSKKKDDDTKVVDLESVKDKKEEK